MKYIGERWVPVKQLGLMLSESILSPLIGGECGFDKLIRFKVFRSWFIRVLGLTQRWPRDSSLQD